MQVAVYRTLSFGVGEGELVNIYMEMVDRYRPCIEQRLPCS